MRLKLFVIGIISALLLSVFPQSIDADSKQAIQDEIIYRIFIDRFNNGDPKLNQNIDIHDPLAYNGGDIKGITLMLDEIAKAGFTMITISPIMKNADKGYHGNWVEDFYKVEEQFGSMESLNELITKAHEKNIKVVLDFVTNYVAKSSPLVQETDKNNWFKENKVEPIDATKWLDEVYVLDQDNIAVQDYLIDVATYWMNETDIDGFNLQAIDQMAPSFVERLADEVKAKNPNFYLLGSTLQGAEDIHYLYDYKIDAIENWAMLHAMNETFIHVNNPISKLHDTWLEVGNNKDILLVDNHLTARFSNNFAEKGRNAMTTWKLALAYMYFTPGVPMIYQGSEVPMYGPGFPENQMIVDFISADPDLAKAFNQLASLRKRFPALVHGDFEQVASNEGMSLFKRTLDDEIVYVAINNDTESHSVKLTGIDPNLQLRGLLYDDTVRENKDGEFIVGISRESAEVFIVQPKTGLNIPMIAVPAGIFIIFVIAVIILSRKQKIREANEIQS